MIAPGVKEELRRITEALRDRLLLEGGLGIDFVPKAQKEINEVKSLQAIEASKPSKEQRLRLLEELAVKASTCTKCRLSQSRTRVVYGAGNPFAELMFIGEAPGYEEDQQGLPFVGKAGQLLTKIIQAIKLDRKDVYITNMVKCRPPGNRTPREDEVFTCTANYLRHQIEWISPRIICTLGGVATQGLLERREPVGLSRGKVHYYRGIKLIATFHPAYLLRNPQDKPKCWHDMKKLRRMLDELGA